MTARKKHIRTPYEDERKKHRAATSRHVLVLEAQIKEDDKRKLFHIANDLRVCGNHLTNIAQKRLSQLFRTKAYREALKQYHDASSVLSSLDKGTPKYHEAKEKVKDAADVLEKLQAKYKLTMEDLRHDMAEISKGSKINTIFLLSETENIWAAVQSVLYRSGKHLNYAKHGELPLIRAKQIERGITLSFVDGVPRCKIGSNELANRIRAMGDDITIERSNAKALQKRAKPSIPEQGKKQKSRKRFGYSILHRCPGHLYAQLHSKFGDSHFHVGDNMYRASQYDHKSNTYNKKKLSQRWHKFEDGTKVQRDIYSAFLLLCHNDDFKTINQDICVSKYETFKKAHDKCISDIKVSGHKVCNSGI